MVCRHLLSETIEVHGKLLIDSSDTVCAVKNRTEEQNKKLYQQFADGELKRIMDYIDVSMQTPIERFTDYLHQRRNRNDAEMVELERQAMDYINEFDKRLQLCRFEMELHRCEMDEMDEMDEIIESDEMHGHYDLEQDLDTKQTLEETLTDTLDDLTDKQIRTRQKRGNKPSHKVFKCRETSYIEEKKAWGRKLLKNKKILSKNRSRARSHHTYS